MMSPHLECSVRDDDLGIIGHLVVHNTVHGRSVGGVRLVPDISVEETRALARIMAYKSGFIGLRMGGAKAMVRVNSSNPAENEQVLTMFGRGIAPLIRSGAYTPGIDMNCTLDDLQQVFHGASVRRDLSSWRDLSHLHTAWSCYVATLVALESHGVAPSDATYSVQGFGKVGGEYSKLMAETGARLVSISNRAGAIVNETGFRVADLIEKRQRHGAGFITDYSDGHPVDPAQVLERRVTILLPAARPWAIHARNVESVAAGIIICAANVPMDAATERQLFDRGKIVVTDFVANCGGLLGSVLNLEVEQEVIRRILSTIFRDKVTHLLAQSNARRETIYDIARKEAEDRIASWADSRPSRLRGIRRLAWRRAPRKVRADRWIRFYRGLWLPN